MSAHHLYRHFDAEGRLLYIGQSISAFERFRKHRQTAGWAGMAASMEIEYFENREQARTAEIRAIRAENPAFNLAGLVKRKGRPITVDGPVTSIRLTPELTALIKEWSDRQDDKPRHSIAIRRLIERGLRKVS